MADKEVKQNGFVKFISPSGAGHQSGPEYQKGGAKAKGFASNPQLAKEAGRIGGSKRKEEQK